MSGILSSKARVNVVNVGASKTIASMNDVAITTPANLDLLVYKSSTAKWTNRQLVLSGDVTGTIAIDNSGHLHITTSLSLNDAVNVRYNPEVGFQWWNADTELWHTLLCVGNPPQLGWDSGSV